MGGGGGDTSAADESNRLMREQIDQQEEERKRKTKSLYSDTLVSLKSQGQMRIEPKGGIVPDDEPTNPGLEPASKMEGSE